MKNDGESGYFDGDDQSYGFWRMSFCRFWRCRKMFFCRWVWKFDKPDSLFFSSKLGKSLLKVINLITPHSGSEILRVIMDLRYIQISILYIFRNKKRKWSGWSSFMGSSNSPFFPVLHKKLRERMEKVKKTRKMMVFLQVPKKARINVFFWLIWWGISCFRFWKCREWKCHKHENAFSDPTPTLNCLGAKSDQSDQVFWGLQTTHLFLF